MDSKRGAKRRTEVLGPDRKRCQARRAAHPPRSFYDDMHLKVNASNSAVTRAFGREFLGNGLWPSKKTVVKRGVEDSAGNVSAKDQAAYSSLWWLHHRASDEEATPLCAWIESLFQFGANALCSAQAWWPWRHRPRL